MVIAPGVSIAGLGLLSLAQLHSEVEQRRSIKKNKFFILV
jgi:hypothetical protein